MFGHDNHDNNEQNQGVTPDPAIIVPATDDNNVANIASTTGAFSDTTTESSSTSQDLLDIKQKVLQELTPLVHHLDQDPLEKFQTTMMMIQASDDQALISEAYNAAQGIKDEKAKAQALLDIVKEINYFTQERS